MADDEEEDLVGEIIHWMNAKCGNKRNQKFYIKWISAQWYEYQV